MLPIRTPLSQALRRILQADKDFQNLQTIKFDFALVTNLNSVFMNAQRFPFSSEQCELILAFEAAPTLSALAQHFGRDISVVSRSLAKIAEKLSVVEKKSGRWILTDMGRKLNNHTRDSMQFQHSLAQKQTLLRIGTNREFAARIVGPRLKELLQIFPQTILNIHSFESGTETPLLEGLIDIGLDCERPFAPEIAYKLFLDEKIVAVSHPRFFKKYQPLIQGGELGKLPHLLCDRLFPDRILELSENQMEIIARFNDIATARSACIAGLGWALLPLYAVQTEIDNGELQIIETIRRGTSKYGVWWLRGRVNLKPQVERLSNWLKTVEI